jgi:hypothetical protein
VGNILALTTITVNTGATVDGRLLARNGAVTLQNNTIGQTVHLEGITLTPASSTNPFNTSHTVTATVAGTGDPVVGRNVTFTIVDGPNEGLTSTVLTDSNGQASFTYMTSSSPGTDTIEASFVNSQGATVTSNQVTKTWTGFFVIPEVPLGTVSALILPLLGLTMLLIKRRAKIEYVKLR